MKASQVQGSEAERARVAAAIRESRLGTELPEDAIDFLSRYGTYQEAPAGAEILHQDDLDSSLLILHSGRAEVSAYADEPIYRLSPGMIFGEVALLDEKPRSATVRAVEDCTLIVLAAEGVHRLIEESPALGVALLRNLAKLLCTRIRAGNQQIAALLTSEELREGKV